MPADIITRIASKQDECAPVTVKTKATLATGTSWSTTPGLFANELKLRVNGLDKATLVYQGGDSVAQIGTNFAECPPLDLDGEYCQIVVGDVADPKQLTWTGVVIDVRRDRGKVFEAGGVRKVRTHDQLFTVAGLEYLLDRRQIDGSIVHDTTRIGRPLVFNGGTIAGNKANRKKRGNRHSVANADGLYSFSDGSTEAEEWDAYQIISYLLKYFGPVDNAGAPLPTVFELDAGAAFTLLGYKPTLDARNITVLQAINAILHPKRGYCWWVDYTEDGGGNGKAIVHVDTLTRTTVTLPGGGELPANSNRKSVDLDLDAGVEDLRITTNREKRYNRVRCRGARMTSTFTVGFGDSTLAKDWTTDAETAYKAAGSAGAGYGSLSTEEKQKLNDAVRRRELLDRVYSCFRIPAAWDKKSGDGASSEGRNWTFADVSPTGSFTSGLPILINGIRVLARTMLLSGVDYTDPLNPTDNNPAGTEVDYVAPFAVLKVASSPDKWQFADKLNNAELEEGTPVGDIKTSYHVYAQQHSPGIQLKSSRGVAHTIALDRFGSAEPTATPPEVDYESLRVTLTAEADTFAEGVFPDAGDTGAVPADTVVEELLIDVGDDYRLDFLPGNTVIDVQGGELITTNDTTSKGRLLRDDRKQLRDMARFAYEWYQTGRASLSFTLNQSHVLFDLGMLITTLGDAETAATVNTVIGTINYDLRSGTQTVATLGDAVDLPGLLQ